MRRTQLRINVPVTDRFANRCHSILCKCVNVHLLNVHTSCGMTVTRGFCFFKLVFYKCTDCLWQDCGVAQTFSISMNLGTCLTDLLFTSRSLCTCCCIVLQCVKVCCNYLLFTLWFLCTCCCIVLSALKYAASTCSSLRGLCGPIVSAYCSVLPCVAVCSCDVLFTLQSFGSYWDREFA